MNTKRLLIVFIWVVALGVLIQLVWIERTNPPVGSEFEAPPEVTAVLRASRSDCDSSQTRWP